MESNFLNSRMPVSEKIHITSTLRKQTTVELFDLLSFIAETCDVPVAGVIFKDEYLSKYEVVRNQTSEDDAKIIHALHEIGTFIKFNKAQGNPTVADKALVTMTAPELKKITNFEFCVLAPLFGHKGTVIGGLIVADMKMRDLTKLQRRLLNIQANQITREFVLRSSLNQEIDLHRKLQERKRLLRLVLDNIPARVWLKDGFNNVVSLNAESAKSTGQSVERNEGKSGSELWPKMADKYYSDDLEVFASGKPRMGIIERFFFDDGSYLWIKTDRIPYRDHKTGKDFMLVVATDITKLKEFQEQISTDTERLELIGSGSNVGLWDWPILQAGDIWWSPVYHEMMGDPERKLKPNQETFKEVLHPDDIIKLDEVLKKHFKDRKAFSIECRLKHAEKGYCWYLISGQASWNENGLADRIMGSLMDIDELKTVQLNYDNERKKLAEANKELDHFAYVASHDLKAPLRGMSNLIKWVKDDISSGDTGEVDEQLNLLQSRVTRMDMLLKDILSFSRAGRNQGDVERFHVKTLIQETLEWIQVPNHIDIKIIDPLPHLNIQKTPIEQIFLNLISNAVKHHDKPQGCVEISCEESYFDYKFSIRDDGPGIPSDYREIIFEPFKRLVARDDVEGSGLGLSIVKKMVESVNGTIVLEDFIAGAGTTFHVVIPKNTN